MQNENAKIFLHQAAFGGNVEILQTMITDYKTKGKPTLLSNKGLAEKILTYSQVPRGNVIYVAIHSKSIACVKLLYDQLRMVDEKQVIRKKQLLTDLLHAVRSNQPHMVNFFID